MKRAISLFVVSCMILSLFSFEIYGDDLETSENINNNITDSADMLDPSDDTLLSDKNDNEEEENKDNVKDENTENKDNTDKKDEVNTDNTENSGNIENKDNLDNIDNIENIDNVENTDNIENIDNTDNIENTDNTENNSDIDNISSSIENIEINEKIDDSEDIINTNNITDIDLYNEEDNIGTIKKSADSAWYPQTITYNIVEYPSWAETGKGKVILKNVEDKATDEVYMWYLNNYGAYSPLSYSDIVVNNTNPDVVDVIVSQKDGHLFITFKRLKESNDIKITIGYTIKEAKAETGVFGNLYYAINGDLEYIIIDSEIEMDGPVANDIPNNSMININCKENSTHNAYINLKSVNVKYKFGSVYYNDGRFDDRLESLGATRDDYPYLCDMIIDKQNLMDIWNKNFSTKYGKHHLFDKEDLILTFISDGEKWYYFTEDIPLTLYIDKNVYNVTWKDGYSNGVDSIIKNQIVKSIDNLIYPENPERKDYIFDGWEEFIDTSDDEIIYVTYRAKWKNEVYYSIIREYIRNGTLVATVTHNKYDKGKINDVIGEDKVREIVNKNPNYFIYKIDNKVEKYNFKNFEDITLQKSEKDNVLILRFSLDTSRVIKWIDGYTDNVVKELTVYDLEGLDSLYPEDLVRENYIFDGWKKPVEKDKEIIIEAKWVSKVLENVKLNLSVVCTTKDTDNFVIENVSYDVVGEPEKGEANYKYIVKLSETENDLLEIINSKLENYHILDITKENKKELILTYNEETNEWFTEDTFIIYICDGYIVSFDTNGADEDSIDNQYIPEGKSASEPKKLTKRGHTFVKWVDADGNTYTFKDEVKSDIVLKAVWSINKYKVKVKYVDKNGVEIRESYNSEVEYNSDYSIESPSISGYSLSNQEQSIIKGKMDIEDIEVIVIYIKSSSGSSSKPPYIVLPPVKEEEIKEEDIPLDNLPETINYHKAYIFGYPNGNVGPYDWTTRGEVAQMIYNLMDEDFRSRYYTLENNFKDVEKGSWYNAAISTVNAAKIAMGYGNGLFGADDRITRGDLAVMLTRFFKNGEVENSVSINDLQDTYAKEAIEKVVSYGWMGLDDTGNFRQNDWIIRGDCITIINGILDRYTKKEHMYDGMKEWPDNAVGAKYYEAIQEATNSHNCEQIDGLELWLK